MTKSNILSSIFGNVLSASHIDLTALEAKINLYALQGVAAARVAAITWANNNLGKLAGPDQRTLAVNKGMELYQTFEGTIPMLALTTLDDLFVREMMEKAVDEMFAFAQTTLDHLSQQATTAPALPVAPVPNQSAPAVPTVPDTTFPAPVTDAPELPTGDAPISPAVTL